ncbi:MAG: T9SS type A sorting domain-containing protein [Candidatus Aegiribacteria sp.]|nr:T9SS type A sorting domain-containing protein [Candidatus Aegiribacteria sp.]MBD3295677.1 T9SS type A sorting domain-containing protein [Candidatus Fermentibacteria bacterium]
MRSVFFPIVLISLAFAKVDLTFIGDCGYVAWNLNNEHTYISSISTSTTEYICESEELSLSNFSSGGQDYLALGCTENDGCGPGHIYVVDPQTCDVVNSRNVSVEEYGYQSGAFGFGQLNLPKHSEITDSYVMMGHIWCCVTDGSYIYPGYIVSSRLDLSDIDNLSLIDTLCVELTTGGYTWTAGPVSSQSIDNLSVSTTSLWQPYDDPIRTLRMRSHLHQMVPSRADSMLTHCFCLCGPFESTSPLHFELLGLGSSSGECLTLWEDTANTVFSTVFTGGIVPESTVEFPYQEPSHDDAVALTCNPDDPGMLLVWYEPSIGEIRMRHYQDEWNDYYHILPERVGIVEKGNIAVYSIDDGYWIAWLENGASQPKLAFIDRSMVTAISDEAGNHESTEVLKFSSNPFRGSVTILVEGTSTESSIQLFDMTGRRVDELVPTADDSYIWDGCDASGHKVAAGVYLLRVETSAGILTGRLLLLN